MIRDECWIELSVLLRDARRLASLLEESSERIDGLAGLATTSAEREARYTVSWLEIALQAIDEDIHDDDDGSTWQEWPEDADCQGVAL